MDNLSKNISISKLNVKDKNLYVKIVWKNNETELFHLKIYDGDVTWSGRLSKEFAKKYRERFEQTEEQYNDNVLKSLKGTDTGEFSYDFTISADDNKTASLTWKKRFEDSMHRFAFLVHGSVPVHRDEIIYSKDLLLDFLLEENRDLRTTIDHLTGKNKEIVADLKKCKVELEKFVDVKTSLETSLYGKFVQLLNAKKRRIQLLETNLNKLADCRDFLENC